MKGEAIRRRLAQVGMTQAELARLLGVPPRDVSRMLCASNVRTGALERICEALRLPVTFFYGDAPARRDSAAALDGGVTKMRETVRLSDKVRGLLKSQHKKFAVLYRHIGMTDAGLRRAFDRDSCNVSVLLKMAEFFNVPVTYFLPEDRHAKRETEKDREIEYLKGQLRAYENTLAAVLRGMNGAESAGLSAIHAAGE